MIFSLFALGAAILLHGRTAAAQDGTPCEIVSSMSAAYVSEVPEATVALVPAEAAANCLKSVPVDVAGNQALLEEMLSYLSWQSTLGYLKNPPEGYTGQQVDVVAELKKISTDVGDGVYDDEYTFMTDVWMAFVKTYDFHTLFTPDIFSVFQFRRGNDEEGLTNDLALVSVSSDGKELPQLYDYSHVMLSEGEGWTPSPITRINNQSAEEYVKKWSEHFPYHEDHTRYNMLFPNQATGSTGSGGNMFGRSELYDGESTTVEHENGTVRELMNYVTIGIDEFDGVDDGEAFFRRFCNQGRPRPSQRKREEATKSKRQNSEPTAIGYPKAQLLHSEAVIGGYFLSGQGYDDVAVLSIPSFAPGGRNGVEEFQDVTGKFLKDASNAGKKKLVIDLRGNGGGVLFLGYDLFKQLFPSLDPYGAARYRAHDTFDIVGRLVTQDLEGVTYEAALEDYRLNRGQGAYAALYKSPYNYKLPLDVNGENFTSWEDYYGPHEFNGDKFTTVARWDLNNFFSDDLSMDVTGFRTRADKLETKQPFEAENIVLLQDGGCGSTCAIFAEFAKSQGAVQQVVAGGKPETGPMQSVAGSKGAQVWYWDDMYDLAAGVYVSLPEYQEQLNETDLGKLVFAQRPLMRTAWQANGKAASSINLRDNIRMNDEGQTPLEFVYEAADCRVFYTPEMIRDVEAVWRKTVDARWGDAKKVCVEGSTGHKTSLSGGDPTVGQQQPKKKGSAMRLAGPDGVLAALVVGVIALTVW